MGDGGLIICGVLPGSGVVEYDLYSNFWRAFRKASFDVAHSGGNRSASDLLAFPFRLVTFDGRISSGSISAAMRILPIMPSSSSTT